MHPTPEPYLSYTGQKWLAVPTTKSNAPGSSTTTGNVRPPPEVSLCLNKDDCKGQRRYMSYCTKTTVEKKGELVKDLRAKQATVTIRWVGEKTDNTKENVKITRRGGIQAKSVLKVTAWVSGDYGSKHTVISDSKLN